MKQVSREKEEAVAARREKQRVAQKRCRDKKKVKDAVSNSP